MKKSEAVLIVWRTKINLYYLVQKAELTIEKSDLVCIPRCDIKMWVNFPYISCKCEWFCNFLESLVTTIYWFSFHVLRQDCLPSQCTSALPHLWSCLWQKNIWNMLIYFRTDFLPFFELQPSHLAFPLKSSMPGFSLSIKKKKIYLVVIRNKCNVSC